MKKSGQLLLGLLICVVVIAISYIWATSLMTFYVCLPVTFTHSAPRPGEASGTRITRSLIIVLIDALRNDTSLKQDVMPFLNQLRNEGASATMHSRPPSYSEPGYTVLLTGAWPDISDGPVINLDYAEIPEFSQDDIFSAAKRAGLFTAVSGYYWFEKLIPQAAVSTSFYTPGEDQSADREVTDAALPWLQAGTYNLVLIHLDQVDYAGHHEGGPIDPRWDAAATRTDALLEEIVSAMDLNQDTLLVISDHGQIDQGGHGGQDPIVLLEPFVMVGKGVIPGDYGDVDMVDVAPTVAALLGANIPGTDQGQPQVDMLDFSLSQVDKIHNVLSKQQDQLAIVYETAIGKPVIVQASDDIVTATQEAMDAARESRLNSERLPRGIFAIVFVLMIINLIAWISKPNFSWFLLGVVTYLVVFNFKYVMIDHKTYSLSSVLDATNLIMSTAITTFIALIIGWIVVLIGTKAYKQKSKQTAITTLKFILTTLSILSIPIFIHYVINGAVVTWTLPDFLTSFLGLLFLIQTLLVAVIGFVLVGLSALIGLIANRNTVDQEN